MKIYLKSGDFARLCHTTKDTLLHYDRKGVFRPAFVSANGYRRYGIEQYFEFDLISLLRGTGSSLEEVKLFRDIDDSFERLAMLKERVTTLERERRLLERRENKLRRLVELAEEALGNKHDVIRFEERPAEFMRIFQVQAEKMTSSVGSVESYSASLASGDLIGNELEAPLGVLVPEDSISIGKCKMSYLFFQATEDSGGEKIEMPAGLYAVMFHNDSVAGHISRFPQMLEELHQLGWKPSGHGWLFDQMSSFLHGTEHSYITKYMIRVERREGWEMSRQKL